MEKSYEIAANWWATRIKNGKKFNNGENDTTNFLASLLATQNALNAIPNEEKLNKFEKVLAKRIKEELKETSTVIIKVDYNPDDILLYAAQKAEIDSKVFPWKTIVWVEKNKVTVRDGYDGKIETIFNS